ncbi:MAG: guanylate kinase, partial [Lentisphaeria bacterium]|nr:guanylate kinase [Lentisphaeria bacterium]
MTLVISGPSGSGKSSLYKAVSPRLGGIEFSVSCTTRQPRAGEVDGKDYHFLTKEEFETRVSRGDFAEYAQVHGNYYGTLKSELSDRMVRGADVVLDIDVQGAM